MSFECDELDGNTLSSVVGLHVCCCACMLLSCLAHALEFCLFGL